MRQQGLGLDPFPAAFSLARQGAWSTFFVVMRVADDPAQAAAPLRRLVREIDPELGAYDVREMEHVVAASVARPRFSMLVLGVFALAALTIAAVGVYGVVAYSVAVRTHELGVRLALGASRGRMLRLVLSQAALLSGTAVVIGLGVGIAGSSVLRNMLFQIDPVDPITFAAMPLLLIGVALLAAYQPARRAVRLDPIRALRSE
jgi:putative ABC transport system permease protein